MIMPTREQRVKILVHHAWDLRDAGKDDESIVQHIIDEGVPAPVISGTLFARFSSRGHGGFADKLLSAMRYEFGGHLEKKA